MFLILNLISISFWDLIFNLHIRMFFISILNSRISFTLCEKSLNRVIVKLNHFFLTLSSNMLRKGNTKQHKRNVRIDKKNYAWNYETRTKNVCLHWFKNHTLDLRDLAIASPINMHPCMETPIIQQSVRCALNDRWSLKWTSILINDLFFGMFCKYSEHKKYWITNDNTGFASFGISKKITS